MIVERNPNGSITVSEVIGLYLESMTFYDYTVAEAVAEFMEINPEAEGLGK